MIILGIDQTAVAGEINHAGETSRYENNKPAESYSDQIIITATRRQTSTFDAPYSIHTLNKQDFQHRQIRNLPEALTGTPGVLVQKTANGHGSPFIRGFTGYRTLALIDGVRYNNSVYRDGPNEYFSLIDFNSLEGLELVSGPGSILYGSDAIGGTLNLKTRSSGYQSEKPGQFFMHGGQSNRLSTAESSHLSRSELQMGKGRSWGLNLGFSYKGFGDVKAAGIGPLPKTGYEEYSYDTRVDIRINATWDMTYVHQSLAQDDVWRTHSTIFSRSFAGTTPGTDLRRLKDQERKLNYIKLSGYDVNDFIRTARLTLSYQSWDEDSDRVKGDRTRMMEFFHSRMIGVDLQLESTARIGDFVYGVDYYEDNIDSGRIDFNADGGLDRIRLQGPMGDDATYRIFGAYLQGEIDVPDALIITAGGRLSYVSADIGKFADPLTGLPSSFEDDWFSSVHSIRINYGLNGTWKLWAGISQSFRAPNIADISRFGASRTNETEIAATDLKAEKFLTYEAGMKINQHNFNFTGAGYLTDIRDFITSTPTGRIVDGLTEVSKQNSSDGVIRGIELTADYTFDNNLNLYANMTWLEGELDVLHSTMPVRPVSEPVSRMTPLTFHLGIKWRNAGDTVWFDFSITQAAKADKLSPADMNDTQRIPPGGTPAYTLINLYGGIKINDHLRLNLALKNLLNEAYRTHGSGSNEPGFGVTAGLYSEF